MFPVSDYIKSDEWKAYKDTASGAGVEYDVSEIDKIIADNSAAFGNRTTARELL